MWCWLKQKKFTNCVCKASIYQFLPETCFSYTRTEEWSSDAILAGYGICHRGQSRLYTTAFSWPCQPPCPTLGWEYYICWSIWGLPLNLSVPLCHHIQMIHNWVPWCRLSLPSRIAVRLIFVEIPEDCPVRTEGQKSLIATGIFHPILLPLVSLFSNYVVSVCNSLRSF